MTDPYPSNGHDAIEVVDGVLEDPPANHPAPAESGLESLPAPLRTAAEIVLATPARQVATLAAGGFVAGATTVALAHRRQTKRRIKRRVGKRNGRPVLGEIVASNSFLVDIHLLRRD